MRSLYLAGSQLALEQTPLVHHWKDKSRLNHKAASFNQMCDAEFNLGEKRFGLRIEIGENQLQDHEKNLRVLGRRYDLEYVLWVLNDEKTYGD